MFDPNIPLQVKTPEMPSPLQTVGGLMQLKASMTENALRQADIQESQQRAAEYQTLAQQRQRDLTDQAAIQEAEKDPDAIAEFGQGNFGRLAGRVQPKTLQAMQEYHATLLQRQSQLDTETLKNNATKHQQIADGLNGLKTTFTDPGELVAAYPYWLHQAKQEGILNSGTFPESISKPEDIDRLAAANNFFTELNSTAMTAKELAEKVRAAHAAADESETKAAMGKADLAAYQTWAAKPENAGKTAADYEIWMAQSKMRPHNVTETELASRAAQGDKAAQSALDKLNQSRIDREAYVQGEITKRQSYAQTQIDARMQYIQGQITGRATRRGASPEAAARNFGAALAAARKLNPNFDNLEEQQKSDLLNTLFESFMSNEQPVVAPGGGKPGGFLGLGAPKPVQTVTRQPQQGRGAAPPAAGGGKSVPVAMVQQYATENGIDYATAEAAFRQKGYAIRK